MISILLLITNHEFDFLFFLTSHESRITSHYFYIALGSCAELDTQLILSEKLLFTVDDLTCLKADIERIMKMINGLIRNLRGRES